MTDEKSLLRCTVVKSLHTAERLLVYVAYCIVGSAIVGCVGYIGYLSIPKLLDAIWVVYSVCVTLIFSIPPIVYVIVGIPTVIVAYSFVLCVARELTISDWASREADGVALTVAAVALTVAAVALAVAVALAALTALALAVAVALTVALAVAAALNADVAAAEYDGIALQKIVRFVGAYYHYHNRIKSEKSE